MFAHLKQVLNAVARAGGRAYKSGRPKQESHVESVTSSFAPHPAIPKKAADSRPYTVDGAPLTPAPLPRGDGSRTETNPKGLTSAMSTRYKVFRQNKPNRDTLNAINGIQPKRGPFSTKIPIRIWAEPKEQWNANEP